MRGGARRRLLRAPRPARGSRPQRTARGEDRRCNRHRGDHRRPGRCRSRLAGIADQSAARRLRGGRDRAGLPPSRRHLDRGRHACHAGTPAAARARSRRRSPQRQQVHRWPLRPAPGRSRHSRSRSRRANAPGSGGAGRRPGNDGGLSGPARPAYAAAATRAKLRHGGRARPAPGATSGCRAGAVPRPAGRPGTPTGRPAPRGLRRHGGVPGPWRGRPGGLRLRFGTGLDPCHEPRWRREPDRASFPSRRSEGPPAGAAPHERRLRRGGRPLGRPRFRAQVAWRIRRSRNA
jgi:hypothetical protein